MEDRRLGTISAAARFMNLKCLSALSGQRTIFPFYHVVSDRRLPHLMHLYHYRGEAQFEQDLEALLKYYSPTGIGDYLKGGPGPGSKPQMVLSFDDGLAECHSYIAPLLKRKGIPAIFFLNNDFIDNRGLFYRYRASILIEHLLNEPGACQQAAEYLAIPEDQVKEAILMINYKQQALLDALWSLAGLDLAAYLEKQPVYMSTGQIRELARWGFHMGAHSMDHPRFSQMEKQEMIDQVRMSVQDLQDRFEARPACFAFPFTSDGVPAEVIEGLLNGEVAEVIFGTAGLKKTGMKNFIQRIPMEALYLPAKSVLRAEYLYYLLKAPLGRNNYFKSR